MRFALLGNDEHLPPLVGRLRANQDEVVELAAEDWEQLFTDRDFDAVIVARSDDQNLRDEQLKKLVAADVAIVAVHPACDVLTAYEIEMIRRENRGVLLPYAPGWSHPAWERLTELLANEGASGVLHQIWIERHVADRRRRSVRNAAQQDCHLIRRLLGAVTGVSATGVTEQDESWGNLSINFVGEKAATIRWSVTMPNAPAGSRVSVVGSEGTTTLTIPINEHLPWQWTLPSGETESLLPADEANQVRDQLRRAEHDDDTPPSWFDACLDLEVSECVDKSIRRKRTIELNTSERTEEKTFKGFMSAAGCLMLTAILFAFLGLALFEGLRTPFRPSSRAAAKQAQAAGPGQREADRWPLVVRLWPVYPLAGFLLLQLLVGVARRSNVEEPHLPP